MARCVSAISINLPGIGWTSVPCGKCNYCLGARRDDWSFRIRQELKHSLRGDFITLTYEDKKLPIVYEPTGEYCPNGTLVKRHAQLFLKRLRKRCSAERLRYYLVGEYGTRSDRAHYHILLFGMQLEQMHQVEKAWTYGQVHFGELNDASIHYTTKYVINRVGDYGGREPPFCFMSRKPGIGESYVKTHGGWHKQGMFTFTQVNGIVARLPRYYADKIFDVGDKMYLSDIRESKLEAEALEFEKQMAAQSDNIRYEGLQRIWNHELVFKRLNEKNKL